MKANKLPEISDLPTRQSPELKQRALGRAIRAAQFLTKKKLGLRRITQPIILMGAPVELLHRPVSQPVVTARDGRNLPCRVVGEKHLATDPTDIDEFIVTYTTGIMSDNISAVLKQLIYLLACWFLLKEKDTREEIMITARVAREQDDSTS